MGGFGCGDCAMHVMLACLRSTSRDFLLLSFFDIEWVFYVWGLVKDCHMLHGEKHQQPHSVLRLDAERRLID